MSSMCLFRSDIAQHLGLGLHGTGRKSTAEGRIPCQAGGPTSCGSCAVAIGRGGGNGKHLRDMKISGMHARVVLLTWGTRRWWGACGTARPASARGGRWPPASGTGSDRTGTASHPMQHEFNNNNNNNRTRRDGPEGASREHGLRETLVASSIGSIGPPEANSNSPMVLVYICLTPGTFLRTCECFSTQTRPSPRHHRAPALFF